MKLYVFTLWVNGGKYAVHFNHVRSDQVESMKQRYIDSLNPLNNNRVTVEAY